MSSSQTDVDVRPCSVCDERVSVDGVEAGERFGNVLCRDCADHTVVFEATCDSGLCGWSFRVDGTEFNRGHLRTRAQQEATRHENEKRVFEDNPCHKTEVREVVGDE